MRKTVDSGHRLKKSCSFVSRKNEMYVIVLTHTMRENGVKFLGFYTKHVKIQTKNVALHYSYVTL